MRTVSVSRISPTSITSGSWRSDSTSAALKLTASRPTCRWFTKHLADLWTYSIGSSIVIMCPSRRLFMLSIIVASVVDLPDPVGPVTTTSPSRSSQNSDILGGMPSSAKDLNDESSLRSATAWRPDSR